MLVNKSKDNWQIFKHNC